MGVPATRGDACVNFRQRYYDYDGIPIGMVEWARLFEDYEGRRVGLDQCGPYHVSTVWLGLDHSFGGPVPLIFETMVLDDDSNDVEMARYSTWEQAEEGHRVMVERYSVLIEEGR